MNTLSHKVVYSKRLNALVAVGENAATRRKAGSGGATRRVAAKGTQLGQRPRSLAQAQADLEDASVGPLQKVFLGVSLLGAQISLSQAAVATGVTQNNPALLTLAPNALPTGGVVTTGAATITSSGANMNINQATDKASINWNTFNVGSAASVDIHQNSSSSVLLNRVIGTDASQIMGKITANGQVMLINPNGIVFGKGGSVTATAFTASTLGLSDKDFQDGNYKFQRNGSTAGIVNQGNITTNGGYVALLGASVTNEGKIATNGGDALLAAGNTISIPVSSGGKVKLVVNAADVNTAVSNSSGGIIQTNGGQVLMQAASVRDLLAGVSSTITQNGTINTTGAQGGAVTLRADGGNITVHGNITANSTDANAKGGDIIIGRADENGKVILAGNTDVSGATLESKGGFVETSGDYLEFDGVSVRAKDWLLDPFNVDIDAAAAATIGSNLATTDITIETTSGSSLGKNTEGDGNITVSSAITKQGAADHTLTLDAANGIDINANIGTAAGAGKLNLNLTALGGSATASKGLTVGGGTTINANGGTIVMNGAYTGAASSGVTIASGAVVSGGSISVTGVNGSSLNTGYAGVTLGTGGLNQAQLLASGDIKVNGYSDTSAITISGAKVASSAGVVKVDAMKGSLNVVGKLTLESGNGATLTALDAGNSIGVNVAGDITGKGNVTIEGKNSATIGIAAGVNQTGKITTDGAISIKGESTGTGYGVYSSGGLTSTGGKNITVEGIGVAERGLHVFGGVFDTAGKTTLKGTSNGGFGVRIMTNGTDTTGVSATGDLEINGKSSTNSGIVSAGDIKSANGALTLTGETAGKDNIYAMTLIQGSASAKGNITINGKSTNTANTTQVMNLKVPVESAEGSITINADNANNAADALLVASALTVHGTNSVNLNADTLKFHETGSINAGTSGFVNINTLTPGNQIHIGAASTGSTTDKDRVLGLGDFELNNIKAGTLNIGNSANGGNVTVSTATMSGSNVPSVLNINSGGKITVDGTLTTAADTKALNLSGQQVALTSTGIIDTTVEGAATHVALTGINNGASGIAVSLDAGSQVKTSGGLYIKGQNVAPNNSIGVNVAGDITGKGNVTIEGKNSATGFAAGVNQTGKITTDGAIIITGESTGSGYGVLSTGGLTSTGGKNITVEGIGAAQRGLHIGGTFTTTGKTLLKGTSNGNYGVRIFGQADGSGIFAQGDLEVIGTSVDQNGIQALGLIKSTDGAITLTGETGSASGNGFAIDNGSVLAHSNVTINAKSTNVANTASALHLDAPVESENGSITINAAAAGNTSAALSAMKGLKVSGTNAVNLNADTLSLAGGSIDAGTTGVVNINTLTRGNQIHIGNASTGDTTASKRVLGLDGAALNSIKAGTLNIGETGTSNGSPITGDVTVKTATMSDTNVLGVLNINSGGKITVDGTLTTALGTKALNLTAQQVELTSAANIDADAGATNVSINGSNKGDSGYAVSLAGGSEVSAGGALGVNGWNASNNPDAAVVLGANGTKVATLTAHGGAAAITSYSPGGMSIEGGGAKVTSDTSYVQLRAANLGGLVVKTNLEINSAIRSVIANDLGPVTGQGVQILGTVTAKGAGELVIGGINSTASGSGIYLDKNASVTAEGDITLNGVTKNEGNSSSAIDLVGTVTSTGGDIRVTASSLGATDKDLAIASTGALTAVGHAISLNADTMDLAGKIDAGTAGTVSLDTATEGNKIDLGGANVGTTTVANRVLGLSANTLKKITTGTLAVGSKDTGDINVGQVDLTGSTAQTVELTSGNTITFKDKLTTAASTTGLGVLAQKVVLQSAANIDASKAAVSITGFNLAGSGNAVNIEGGAQITAGGSLGISGGNGNADNNDAAVLIGSNAGTVKLGGLGETSIEGTGLHSDGVQLAGDLTSTRAGLMHVIGTVSGDSGKGINQTAGTFTTGGDLKLSGASVTDNGIRSAGALKVAGKLELDGTTASATAAAVDMGGSGGAQATGDITITGSNTNTANNGSAVKLDSKIASTGGSIGVLAKSVGASVSDLALGANGGLTTTNKAISLNADTMALAVGAKVNAGTGAVSLDTATEGSKIALGGSNVGNTDTAQRVLGLQDATLNAITAGTLNIGSAKAGDVNVASANLTGSGAKAVNITSGKTLTVDGLLRTAVGAEALNLAADQIVLTSSANLDANAGTTNVALTGVNGNAVGNAVNVAGDAVIDVGGSLAVKGTNTDALNTDAAVVMGSPTAKATLTSGGAMSVEGTGTQGSGVVVNTAALNSGGALDITGTTSSATAPAVLMAQGSSATAAGNIKLVGDSLNTAATGSAIALAAPVKSTGGTITVVATSKGTSDKDLAISGAGGLQTTNKDIAVNADTMSYAGTGGINAGTGKVTLATVAEGSQINVGGASKGSATAADRVLGLSADLLKAVTAGTLDVGSTTTKGDVLVSVADMTGSKAAAVNITSGGKLTVDGKLTTAAATKALNLVADQVVLTSKANIDADAVGGGTNVGITAENANATGNAVKVEGGATISTGGTLAVKGTNTAPGNPDAAVVMGGATGAVTLATVGAASITGSNGDGKGVGASGDGILVAGNLTKTGAGGLALTGNASGATGQGIEQLAGTTINATGGLALTGTSKGDNGIYSAGALISGGALGISGTTESADKPALVLAAGSSARAGGDATLAGINTNTAGTASAIELAAPITSTGGTITVQATNAGKSLADLAMSGNAALKTTGRTIALIADTMGKTGAGTIDAGTGLVKLGTNTSGNKINVGGANVADVNPNARELGLSSDLLKAITAGTLDIGSSTGGDVKVVGADMTGGNAAIVNIKSGGKITVDGGLTTAAATKELNLGAAQVALTGNANIDANAGATNVAITGSNAGTSGNAVNIAGGALVDAGGTLAVTGTNTNAANKDAAVVLGNASAGAAASLIAAGNLSVTGEGSGGLGVLVDTSGAKVQSTRGTLAMEATAGGMAIRGPLDTSSASGTTLKGTNANGDGVLIAANILGTGVGALGITGEATGPTGMGINQLGGTRITTTGDLALTGNSAADNGIYSAGALNSGGNLGITGTTNSTTKPAVELAQGGGATAAGDIKITGTNTNPANTGPAVVVADLVKSTGGSIAVIANNAGASLADLFLTGNGGFQTAGKDINLNADTLGFNSTGTINAGTGTVNVVSATAGNKINVGGANQASTTPSERVLGLSQGFLKSITAGTLNVGTKNSGEVNVSGADLTGGGSITNINVNSGGTINVNQRLITNSSTVATNFNAVPVIRNDLVTNPNLVPNLPSATGSGNGGRVSVGLGAPAAAGGFQLAGAEDADENASRFSDYDCVDVGSASVCTAKPSKRKATPAT